MFTQVVRSVRSISELVKKLKIVSFTIQKASLLNGLVLVATCGIGTALSSPAQAASLDGFGCVNDPNCQAYVGYGQVEGFASAYDTTTGGQFRNFKLPVDETNNPYGIQRYSITSQPLKINIGTHALGLSKTVIQGGDGDIEYSIFSEQTAMTSVVGTSSLGQLRGVAEATAGTTGSELFGGLLTSARSMSIGSLYWGDTLTVASSTLSEGTIVPLRVALSFDRSITCNTSYSGCEAFAAAGLGLNGAPGGLLAIYDSTYAPSATSYKESTINVAVGQPFQVQGLLNLDVRAGAYYANPSVVARIEAGHTANFYITPLSSDVTYTTASGKTYFYSGNATAVPEPSLVPGVIIVGLGLGLWRKLKAEAKS